MKNRKINTLVKVIIQILSFIFFAESFSTSLYAVKSLIGLIFGVDSSVSLLEVLIILAATVPANVLFGRYYCGYICSFGAMQDLLNFIVRKIYKLIKHKELNIKISKKADKVISKIKYLVLLALLVCFALGTAINSDYNPWSVFGRVASVKQWPDFTLFWSIGGVLLILIIIASLLSHRAFCRYICPMGAIYSLISHFSIGRKKEGCAGDGHCSICRYKCKKYSVNILGLLITLVLFLAANIVLNEFVYKDGTMTSADVLADGVFTGEGSGFRGSMQVSVIVEEGVIKDITIDSSSDDKKFINKVVTQLIPTIIENQSTDVDVISGATYSSRGLLEAVKNAMGYTEEEESSNMDELLGIEEGMLENLEDGTYEGEAEGFRGAIKVSVTVEDHKVSDVRIISYYDNEEYLFYAASRVIDGIIEKQTLNVDVVSGATYSRNGLVSAVANALGISPDDYQLADAKPRADKDKGSRHVTQKYIESQEQYEELINKYSELIYGADGLKR